MDGNLIAIVVVAVIVPLSILCLVAWVAVRIINRNAKRSITPNQPDELVVSNLHEQFDTDEDTKQSDTTLSEPMNWFEKERFHQDIRDFLKENETPK